MQDITSTLMNSPEFASFLFNGVSSAIFVINRNLRVQKVNDAFKTLFAQEEKDVLDKPYGNAIGCSVTVEHNALCGTSADCAACLLQNTVVAGFSDAEPALDTFISRTFYIDNKPVTKNFRIRAQRASCNGEDLSVIAIEDVTELEEQRQRIKDMANRDLLTNLYNRHYFFEIGESMFQNATRGNISIAVAIFAIDFFRRINDTRGHDGGDSVLKAVSDILSKNLRKADLLARFDGAEFCVLLHCKEPDDPYTVVDKLRLLVEQQPILHAGCRIDVTISAGLTTRLEKTLEDMINHAEEMLTKAKENGRNRTEEYSADK